jgi:hypothetical protein
VFKGIEVRHQVAIGGRVFDAGSHKPLAGAVVNIVDGPAALKKLLAAKAQQYQSHWDAMAERPDRTRTAADGFFHFLDLPDGPYTLAVAPPGSGNRYAVAQSSTNVSRGKEGQLKAAFLEIGIQVTTVHGKVTGAGQKTGLVMAEIRVKGSGERCFSDSRGQYVLAGVEPGKRTILAAAQGYRPDSKAVTIAKPGELATVNFALARETAG